MATAKAIRGNGFHGIMCMCVCVCVCVYRFIYNCHVCDRCLDMVEKVIVILAFACHVCTLASGNV